MSVKSYVVVFLVLCTVIIIANQNTRYPLSIYSDGVDSPSDYIESDDLHVYSDKVVIEKEDLIWAKIRDTHSMEPVLNKDSITLEVVPNDPIDIKEGDIVSYLYDSIVVIHRVISIGEDSEGWYVITKGDNNLEEDPYKVRFSQVKGLVVGILY
ncbi:signal peptidase I [Candidatus Woesearchaeota archaeon]|nr:signal peptidase I [Candidatus Woesearchaeota archaeon]